MSAAPVTFLCSTEDYRWLRRHYRHLGLRWAMRVVTLHTVWLAQPHRMP